MQERGGAPVGLGPHAPAFAGMVDAGALQPIEIAQHVAPLRLQAGPAAAGVEFLAQDEREKRTEHMAANGGIR